MLQSTRNFQQENIDWKSWCPKRGEIFLANLQGIDSEEKGLRPVLIISNNIGNKYSSIVTICPITSKSRPLSRIHIRVGKEEGLKFSSYILCEHIKSVSKSIFFGVVDIYPVKVGELSVQKLSEVEEGILFELGFGSNNKLRI